MAMLDVIGLMSGTSLDGVDAAMIATDGDTIASFGPSVFLPYSSDEQAKLRAATGQWQDGDAAILDAAREIVHDRHLAALSQLPKADLLGFHGQTLAHDPALGRTHQLGDGATIARRSRTSTVWDFRSEDMRQGGQGAPLVPFFHYALARQAAWNAPVAFINIGGVANVTWLDPARQDLSETNTILAFDSGPGNALVNDFMLARTGLSFDNHGLLASRGTADSAMVAEWLKVGYFRETPPKSLDRNSFQVLLDDLTTVGTEDGLASLTLFTARSIGLAARQFPRPVEKVIICGGGRNNLEILRLLKNEFSAKVVTAEQCGLDGDMLEAQAFAYLAARFARELPTTSPATTGARQPVCGGIISKYDADIENSLMPRR